MVKLPAGLWIRAPTGRRFSKGSTVYLPYTKHESNGVSVPDQDDGWPDGPTALPLIATSDGGSGVPVRRLISLRVSLYWVTVAFYEHTSMR